MMHSYLAANEKCCVPMVVKRTLFTVRVASLLLYRCFIQHNICYMHNVIAIRCLIQNEALALVLDNKWLLQNMIDRKATEVPYTARIFSLADNYIFCLNFPAILCIIAIAI